MHTSKGVQIEENKILVAFLHIQKKKKDIFQLMVYSSSPVGKQLGNCIR